MAEQLIRQAQQQLQQISEIIGQLQTELAAAKLENERLSGELAVSKGQLLKELEASRREQERLTQRLATTQARLTEELADAYRENERLTQELAEAKERLQLMVPASGVAAPDELLLLARGLAADDIKPDALKVLLREEVQQDEARGLRLLLLLVGCYYQRGNQRLADACLSALLYSSTRTEPAGSDEEGALSRFAGLVTGMGLEEGAADWVDDDAAGSAQTELRADSHIEAERIPSHMLRFTWHVLLYKLLYRLKDKGYASAVGRWLDEHGETLLQRVVFRGIMEELTDFAKLAFIYECFKLVRESLVRLCAQSDRVSEGTQQEVIFRLFWYGFVVRMEKDVRSAFPDMQQLLDSVKPEAQLYRLYLQAADKSGGYNAKTGEYIHVWKSRVTSFNQFEKDVLFWHYDIRLQEARDAVQERTQAAEERKQRERAEEKERLQRLLRESIVEGLRVHDSVMQTKQEKTHCPECQQELVTKRINLAFYAKKLDFPACYKAVGLPGCESCGLVFLTGGGINRLNAVWKPYRIKAVLLVKDYPPKIKKERPKFQPVVIGGAIPRIGFAWPNTNVPESNGGPLSHQGIYKEVTPLFQLGYRITGTSRIKRWQILEQKAIPALPLREIVYTIANNIRLRKRQVGGSEKFAHAIAEWEYDLQRLKEKYYKHNFAWPGY